MIRQCFEYGAAGGSVVELRDLFAASSASRGKWRTMSRNELYQLLPATLLDIAIDSNAKCLLPTEPVEGSWARCVAW